MSHPPVVRDLESIEQVTVDAARRGASRRPTIVGIVGPPGSGKSHLSRFLADRLPSEHGLTTVAVPMDGFHLSNSVLVQLGRRDRKGSPDTFDTAGLAHLLGRVRQPTADVVYAPAFDRSIEEPIAGSITVGPGVELVLVEGNYLLVDDERWRPVGDQLDLTMYVSTPEAVRRERLVRRHGAQYGSAAADWVERVDMANAAIVESTRHRAEVVIDDVDVPGVARL